MTASYYRYWGKAEEALKAAYCSGQAKEEIVTKFKLQLDKLISLPASRINVSHLDQWPETEDKSRGKRKWDYERQDIWFRSGENE